MGDNDFGHSEMGDATVPQYRFEWSDGSERTTEELPEQLPMANEELARLGREDDDCEVTLVGFST